MAVTAVRLKNFETTLDAEGFRQYTVTYHVETDSVNDMAITARDAAGVPQRGDTYAIGSETDADAWCRSKSARLLQVDDTYKLWEVTCQYSSNWNITNKWPTSTITVYGGPLGEPAKWSGSFVQFTREFFKDRDGNAIVNKAGDPFTDPAITGDESRLSIVVEKNFLFADVKGFVPYIDSINSTPFWGFGAKRLKVQSITFEQKYFLNQAFVTGRMEVHVRQGTTTNTWDWEVTNAGLHDADGEHIKKKKVPVSSPVALTTAGYLLPTTGTVNYIDVQIYPLKDFSAIGFPTVLGAPF